MFLEELRLVSTTTEILTNKITKNEHSIDDKQLNIIRSKIKAYETKVQGLLKRVKGSKKRASRELIDFTEVGSITAEKYK